MIQSRPLHSVDVATVSRWQVHVVLQQVREKAEAEKRAVDERDERGRREKMEQAFAYFRELQTDYLWLKQEIEACKLFTPTAEFTLPTHFQDFYPGLVAAWYERHRDALHRRRAVTPPMQLAPQEYLQPQVDAIYHRLGSAAAHQLIMQSYHVYLVRRMMELHR